MPRKRDYKAEYARRKARALVRGLSVSQARGHPKAGEGYASGKSSTPQSTPDLEELLKAVRAGTPLKHAAKVTGISEEKARRFVKGNGLAKFERGRWQMTDARPRRVPIISGTDQRAIIVPDFETASRVGKHHNAVGRFLRTNDLSQLSEFEGDGVRDANGRFHSFETNPNALYGFAAKDEPAFHEIYQIVSN